MKMIFYNGATTTDWKKYKNIYKIINEQRYKHNYAIQHYTQSECVSIKM